MHGRWFVFLAIRYTILLMPRIFLIISFFVVFFSVSTYAVLADFSCTASVSPSTVATGTYNTLTFQVENTGTIDLNWVSFTPDENFGLVGYESDWIGELGGGTMSFHGGTISPGGTKTFGVNATTGSNIISASWTAQASEAYGAELLGCGIVGVEVIAYEAPTATPTPVPGATATPTPTSVPGATATPTTAASTTSSSTSSSKSTPTPTPKPVDTTAPSISIAFDFSKPFKDAPKITGKALDTGVINPGVAKVEYSTDDGKNWLPVDKLESGIRNLPAGRQGQESSKTFEFTPLLFEDGDYQIRARATDLSGNKGLSQSYKLVIDRLPPQVGGSLISFGSQVILPDINGIIYLLKGLDQKITLSAVGGPIQIDILSDLKTFSLVKNSDNGLWSGLLNFSKSGSYSLTASSLDGAANTTKRIMSKVEVLETGRVTFADKTIKNAEISVFYYEPSGKQFVLWDGPAYGQSNPQKTTGDGSYMLFLPPGSYYISVSAPGFRTFRSDIFKFVSSFPVNSDIILEKTKPFLLFGIPIPIPDFTITQGVMRSDFGNVSSQKINGENLIGKEISQADLSDDGKIVKTSDFRGKPHVLTLINTWLPAASEQIKILENLSHSEQFNVVAILPQESVSRVASYKKRGDYNLSLYADPDGILVPLLNLQSLPTHVFLDRRGIIKSIKMGVLNEAEIRESLIN